MCINLTWNCRVCVGVASSVCWGRSCQALSLWSELNKDGAHFFTLKCECHNRYNKLFCVILKLLILHDAIKTIQSGVFVFLKKGTKTCFFSKSKKFGLKNRWVVFSKKYIFLNPDCLSILCVVFPWSHDLVQVTSLPMWLSYRSLLLKNLRITGTWIRKN